MQIEVLISCMFQKDTSIIQRTNIQSNVLIINQCDENKIDKFTFKNKNGNECQAQIIHTTERGLSKSRNMAIQNATGDICLICDDDECLDDNYVDKINEVFVSYPDIDIAAFKLNIPTNSYIKKRYWGHRLKISYKTALKISSWQIVFKRNPIIKENVCFDEKIGSGVTKAGGEEKIFLHQSLKRGLNIYYFPICIGTVSHSVSQWAHFIFTKDYFIDWGYYTRRLHGGRPFAVFAAFYFCIRKYKEYHKKTSFSLALKSILYGIFIKK
mgnify:CR=1 FL=1